VIRAVTYHPQFWGEVEHAAAWLESMQPGLAEELGEELIHALETVLAFPLAFRPVEGDTRRVILRRFKFHLAYEVDEDAIYFVGFVHASRDFRQWLTNRGA
jgi:plasmid stabilization system protein ParE